MAKTIVEGVVAVGHGVASGRSETERFPHGTLSLQFPYFAAAGLDCSGYHRATLNISIAPCCFETKQPLYCFRSVYWDPHGPAEDFSFFSVALEFEATLYQGLIYYPHPETKPGHFQDPAILEVLCPLVLGIRYGSPVKLHLSSEEITISEPRTSDAG